MASKAKDTKAVTIKDVRLNEVAANAVLDQYPKDVSGAVGIHALGQLAEMMGHDDFVTFLEGAVKHATTGEIPPDQDEQQEQQQQTTQGQPPAGS